VIVPVMVKVPASRFRTTSFTARISPVPMVRVGLAGFPPSSYEAGLRTFNSWPTQNGQRTYSHLGYSP